MIPDKGVGSRGRTVDEHGTLLQTSVSQLEMVDTRDGAAGCMRKWWYRYVAHLREPETDDMRRGTLMHAHLENYVRTGTLPQPPAALPATPEWIAYEMAHKVIACGIAPAPLTTADLFGGSLRVGIFVEQKIEDWGFTVGNGLTWEGKGIPMVGVIDYVHDRERNTGVADIEDSINPPGTIVIGDYKSKNSKKSVEATTRYLLDGDKLTRSIQMAGYGIAAAQRFGASQVRLEHVYAFTEKPAPRKVTRLTVLDPLLRTWEYAGALARGIRDVACERNVDRVDANRFACDKYTSKAEPTKHRCMHAPYCSAYGSNSLSFIFGETAANELKKDLDMSLMKTIPGADPRLASTANLAAEEQTLRAAQAAVAAGPQQIDDATFMDAWCHIVKAGNGQPATGPRLSQIVARLCGQQIAQGVCFAGAGAFAAITVDEPINVLQIASDLGWRRAAPTAPPPPVAQPTPAPVMQTMTMPSFPATPAQISQTVNGSAPQMHPEYMQGPGVPSSVPSILAPDAPASNPALAMVQPTPHPALAIQQLAVQMAAAGAPAQIAAGMVPQTASDPSVLNAAAEQAPKKRGRPRKTPETAINPANQGVTVTNAPGELVATISADLGYPLEVFVDCAPAGWTSSGVDDVVSLDGYIAQTVDTLVKKFCPPPAIPDLRAAPNDGPLGFGKWPAAVRATVSEVPPPPGRYTLHTGGDAIRNEFANSLRALCVATGGLFVDGRR